MHLIVSVCGLELGLGGLTCLGPGGFKEKRLATTVIDHHSEAEAAICRSHYGDCYLLCHSLKHLLYCIRLLRKGCKY